MDPLTPKRSSPSDDFTAVKKLGDLEDRTTLVTTDVVDENTSMLAAPPVGGDLARGSKLGDYVIEEKVGQGGMGSVYRAVHPLIGKYAAIKVLSHELKGEQYNIERFVDEARVVNQIGHPNIVDVFAFGETPDGRSYLVMEWLKGETLRDRIDRAPLELSEIADIVRPLTRALQAAHEKGVIHRDLKPDNVFLVEVRGEVPIVKLLDFGIAKPANTEHRVAKTATGAIVGTPLYIAPEQAKGRAIDSAADVYSLGGMLFELLCRRPPFLADNAMEIVAKHLMEPPPRPSQFVRVPPALDDLVVAMLAKEPLQRPLLPAVLKVLDGLRERAQSNFVDLEPSGRLMPMIPSDSQPVIMRMPTPTPLPEQRPQPLRASSPVPALAAMPVSAAPTTFVRTTSATRKWIYGGAALCVALVIATAIAASGGDKPLESKETHAPPPTEETAKPEATAPVATPIDPQPDPAPAKVEPPPVQPPAGEAPNKEPPRAITRTAPPPVKKDPPPMKPVVKKDPPPVKKDPPVVKKDPPKKDPPKKDPPKKLDPDDIAEPGAFGKPKKP